MKWENNNYGWKDSSPTCIGGDPLNINSNTLEYGIDVDTFLLNGHDPLFANHFKAGDSSFSLKLGVNLDLVFLNFLIVAVDTKVEQQDVPEEEDYDSEITESEDDLQDNESNDTSGLDDNVPTESDDAEDKNVKVEIPGCTLVLF